MDIESLSDPLLMFLESGYVESQFGRRKCRSCSVNDASFNGEYCMMLSSIQATTSMPVRDYTSGGFFWVASGFSATLRMSRNVTEGGDRNPGGGKGGKRIYSSNLQSRSSSCARYWILISYSIPFVLSNKLHVN
jgi:hypothetical protein